jgi:diguanylate cyclase (GGDEF)-like protein/PAS domain S-box-containing protein
MKAKPAYEELEQRIRFLEKELTNCKSLVKRSAENDIFMAQILQSTYMPTFVINNRHIVTHWNKAMENLTGLSAAEMIGTCNQWRSLYTAARPLMADLVIENSSEEVILRYYDGKCRKSTLIEAAFEVEDYFPELDRWLLFTAAPLTDNSGRVIGAMETLQDITDQKKAEEKLKQSEQRYKELSITDSLTKLFNSRHFFRQLGYEVERAKRYGSPLSLILLDIDNFKIYNDTYGHPEGDMALRALSDVIRKNLRATDTAFRYGGEEFTVLLSETDCESAVIAAERLRKDFANLVLSPVQGSEVHMTVSIGVSQYDPYELSSIFLKRADQGMYKAKQQGKNRVFLSRIPRQIITGDNKNHSDETHCEFAVT